ncbi:hypothetical protein GCM10027073_32550 [Streptomyces chlorus]
MSGSVCPERVPGVRGWALSGAAAHRAAHRTACRGLLRSGGSVREEAGHGLWPAHGNDGEKDSGSGLRGSRIQVGGRGFVAVGVEEQLAGQVVAGLLGQRLTLGVPFRP